MEPDTKLEPCGNSAAEKNLPVPLYFVRLYLTAGSYLFSDHDTALEKKFPLKSSFRCFEEVASLKSNSDFGWSESFARDACYSPLTVKGIFGILTCLRLRKKMDLHHSESIRGKHTSSTLLW